MVAFLDMLRGSAGAVPPVPPNRVSYGGNPGLSPDVLSAILAMAQGGGRGGMGGARPAAPAPVSAGSTATLAPTNGPGFVGNGFGSSQIDLSGPWDDVAGMAAGMFLGPVGSLLATLARGGVGLKNAGFADRARGSWGQEPLGFGQNLGAALRLNSYGEGGRTDRLGEFRGTPVAPGGLVREGGFLGIGRDTRGAFTPGEAQRRAAAERYGSPFGGTWSGNRGGSDGRPGTGGLY